MFNNMRLGSLAGISVVLAHLVSADVTIDGFSLLLNTSEAGPTPVESVSVAGITSLSVLSNGATAYAETVVITHLALVGPSTTQTIISTPTTSVFTFVEDASLYSYSIPATASLGPPLGVESIGDQIVCVGTASVTCVFEEVRTFSSFAQTATETLSAVRTPIFTIKSAAACTAVPMAIVAFVVGAVGTAVHSIY